MKVNYFLFVTVAFGLFGHDLMGQNGYRYQIDAQNDNDYYLAYLSDKYYSNGIFFNYRWMSKKDLVPEYPKKIWQIKTGQQIYTPYKSQIDSSSQIDRPFAAYLHVGVSLHLLRADESSHRVTLNIGTIGANAQGEKMQKLYHKTIRIFHPRGWEFQLRDEVGINIVYNYLKLLYSSKNRVVDIGLPVEIRLGNTFSGISMGALFRFGKLNPYYVSAYTNSLTGWKDNKTERSFEYYFYVQPQWHYVAYDATIQGRLFGKDDENAKPLKHMVLGTELGGSFSTKQWTIKCSAHFKTKEVDNHTKPHKYGSISLAYRF